MKTIKVICRAIWFTVVELMRLPFMLIGVLAIMVLGAGYKIMGGNWMEYMKEVFVNNISLQYRFDNDIHWVKTGKALEFTEWIEMKKQERIA